MTGPVSMVLVVGIEEREEDVVTEGNETGRYFGNNFIFLTSATMRLSYITNRNSE